MADYSFMDSPDFALPQFFTPQEPQLDLDFKPTLNIPPSHLLSEVE
eukprot:CAMPEP_0168314828 /NCGR_PEP_ID=MMETSP0210-20121227/9546_1 /TAXON_ID=40633 /ORGANISM="Condylostoma magnum, Strain COL2" /LENGTH=45 /DNA_ID= /DNA_START= /DNA_END= /DNA_ORIENTATION=